MKEVSWLHSQYFLLNILLWPLFEVISCPFKDKAFHERLLRDISASNSCSCFICTLMILKISCALLAGRNNGGEMLPRATADCGVINSVNHQRKQAYCQCRPWAPCHPLLWWGCQPCWVHWQIAKKRDGWGEMQQSREKQRCTQVLMCLLSYRCH